MGAYGKGAFRPTFVKRLVGRCHGEKFVALAQRTERGNVRRSGFCANFLEARRRWFDGLRGPWSRFFGLQRLDIDPKNDALLKEVSFSGAHFLILYYTSGV